MNQAQNITLIRRLVNKLYPPPYKIRFIKIHGGKFQESGLPDLMILIADVGIMRIASSKKYWLEIKRNWKDAPSKLQIYNINGLRDFGYITAFVAENEFKYTWNAKEPDRLINLF